MPVKKLAFYNPFLSTKRNNHISIKLLKKEQFKAWHKAQKKSLQMQANEQGFAGKSGQLFVLYDSSGHVNEITAGTSPDFSIEDGSKIRNAVASYFSKNALKKLSFSFEDSKLSEEESSRIHVGWGFACHHFSFYKSEPDVKNTSLVISKTANKRKVKAFVESVCLIRDLVNIPANDMGPEELEKAVKFLTQSHEIEMKVIKDEALNKKNFPMIYEVGKGSPRRPRLIDFKWGNSKHPKVTLVGKGVCFDTGGLDIKPSSSMLTMKKDMGGAAHVLGLAHLIISLKLPIRLRVLIPAVENSISGESYRPSDILKSRKGITVEVGNTDAEGRLILADTLTYACEDNPKLLIDFATLTGAARIAVGYDLPALFSNKDEIAQLIQKKSAKKEVEDPVWHLPLWKPYRKDLDSNIADISSTGGRAGATTAALFLQEFISDKVEWIHMDIFAWEQNGRAGRPKGGSDTGMRAIFSFLEYKYNK